MGRLGITYIVATGGQPITDQSEAETLNDQPEKAPEQRRRPRRARRIGLFALVGLLVPAGLIALVLLAAVDRPLVAPEWMRQRLEQAAAAQVEGVDISFGEVSLVIEDNWDPRLRVRNLELRAPDNRGGVTLARVDARLALAELRNGQVAPREIRVSGVFLRIIRLADGTVNISVGDGGGNGPFGEDTQIATIGDQIEGYLDLPLLAQLETFRLDDMTLRYEDVRARRGWTVDGGQMRLDRDGEDIEISTQMTLLGGRAYATSIEAFLNTSYETSATQFGVSFEDIPSGDIASQTAALTWLEIVRAPLSGSLRGETDSEGRLGPVNATLRVDAGVLQPDDAVPPVPFEGLRSYLTYDPTRGSITFDELSLDSKWIKATASGKAILQDMEQGLPGTLLGQLELSRFEANPKELDDVPMVLNRSFADFRLRLNPFELDLGQMVIHQGEHRMTLSGELDTTDDQWEFSVDGHSDGLDVARVLNIWPDRLKPNLRKWIAENIHAITLHDINLAMRSRVAAPPEVYVDFQFSDAELKVLKTMPPVQEASGYASLIRNQFRVAAESGTVLADQGGRVDVTGTGFIVEDTRIKQSPALVQLRARSSVTAAASLLDREPLRVFTKARLPVDLAKGWAEVEGEARLTMKPKVEPEDVQYEARGVLRNVVTTHFIKDKVIRADMQLLATNKEVALRGAGTVGALPFEGRWHMLMGKENAGKSQVTGTAELSQRAVDEFNIGLPKGTVSGEGKAAFVIDLVGQEPPQMTMTSDLAGVVLSAPPLGWRKPADKVGTFEADVTLTSPLKVERIAFDADGLTAEGDITLSAAGGLETMRLERFEVGRWLRGTGMLQGRGAGSAPAIVMTSGMFDMRHMPRATGDSGSSGTGGATSPISARMDLVQVTDDIFLTDVKADLSTHNGIAGTFTGAFKGGPGLTGELTPHEHGTALTVTSPKGGKIAVAMGVVNSATRGDMRLTLTPHKTRGVYDGRLNMENVKVQQVPVVAELLNAISVVGLIEQLNGPGLLFSEVFSRFRITPQQLVIAESSAVGPSLGISADGIYTFETKRFDVQGTVSPLYAVNFIGRPISKRGEGLIGFNYTMRGPSNRLQFGVNPLSAFTPGFFREIFKRPPPDLSN